MGAHEPQQRLRMLVRPAAAYRQHFLRRTRQDLAHEVQDKADAEIDRDRVPGRTNAKSIHLPVGKTFDHVRGRQDHETDILVGIDAASRHPESQMVVVGVENGNVIPNVSGSSPLALRFAMTRASVRADTSGSMMFPSAAAAIAA